MSVPEYSSGVFNMLINFRSTKVALDFFTCARPCISSLMVHAGASFSGSSAKEGIDIKPTQKKLVKKMNLPSRDKLTGRDEEGLFPEIIEIEPVVRGLTAVMLEPPGKLPYRLFNGGIAFRMRHMLQIDQTLKVNIIPVS